MLSRKVLDRLDWQPWAEGLDRNLDGSLRQKLEGLGVEYRTRTMAQSGPVLVLHGHDVCLTEMKRIKADPIAPEVLIEKFGAEAIGGLTAFARQTVEALPAPAPACQRMTVGAGLDDTARALAETARVQRAVPSEASLAARANWLHATRRMIRAVVLDAMSALAHGWTSGGYPPAELSRPLSAMLRDLPAGDGPEEARSDAEAEWMRRHWYDRRDA
jgi:hypothetical protein